MEKFDIFAVTTCLYDMTSYVSHYPGPGEKILAKNFTVSPGGKAANQAVQAALLGAKVAVVGKIGNDKHGGEFRDKFSTLKINCDNLTKSSSLSTGVSSIIVDELSGEGHTVVIRGANDELCFNDIVQARDHLENSKLLLCTFSPSVPAVYCAMEMAKAKNIPVLLNAAPIVKDFDHNILLLTDILCVNEDEAEFLSGRKIFKSADAMCVLETFLDKFPNLSLAIITMGGQGCVFCERHSTPEIVLAPKVQVVDSTGAGDSFVGALAFYLTHFGAKLSRAEMTRRACHIASGCVSKRGAQSSYLSRDQLPDFLFDNLKE